MSAIDTPESYIGALEEPRRGEIEQLDRLIRETLPSLEPHVRSGMLGYGEYHYRYASGREGDAAPIALASNKQYISLYVPCEREGAYVAEAYADKLPKATVGKSCVRFKRIADVDLAVVRELLEEAHRVGPMSAV